MRDFSDTKTCDLFTCKLSVTRSFHKDLFRLVASGGGTLKGCDTCRTLFLFGAAILASMLALTSTNSSRGIARSMSCITLISWVALLTRDRWCHQHQRARSDSEHTENSQLDQGRCWQPAQKFSKMCLTISEYYTNGISV